MGRIPILRLLLAVGLLAGVALAQQGLIIEPWRASPSPPPAAAVAARAVPPPVLPGLGAPRAAQPNQPRVVAPAAPSKWSPPVVELLVDPWARDHLAAPARPRWVPERVEIIDPWADAPPRVASRPAGAPHSAIF